MGQLCQLETPVENARGASLAQSSRVRSHDGLHRRHAVGPGFVTARRAKARSPHTITKPSFLPTNFDIRPPTTIYANTTLNLPPNNPLTPQNSECLNILLLHFRSVLLAVSWGGRDCLSKN